MTSADENRYIVKRELIEIGGYMTVYSAEDRALDREVRLHVLQAAVGEDSEAYVKFRAECRALAGLSHPGILEVLDFGRSEDRVFYVTNRAPGLPLAEFVAEGPLEPEVVVEFGVQLAETLAYLHSQELLHRGLSLSGVHFDVDSGQVVICDFSLLKDLAGGIATLPALLGAVRLHLLPERQQGKPADPRSDVFLAGALLYALACGRDPLAPKYLTEEMRLALKPVTELNPECPASLERVILRALEVDPAQRPSSALELARELESVRRKLLARKLSRPLPAVPRLPAAPRSDGAGTVREPEGAGNWLAAFSTGPRLGAVVAATFCVTAFAALVTRPAAEAPSPPATRGTVATVASPAAGHAPPVQVLSPPAGGVPGIARVAALSLREPTTETTFNDRWSALADWVSDLPSAGPRPFERRDLVTLRMKVYDQPIEAFSELDRLIAVAARQPAH
ncbi:MAG: serine/threonine protein kinase [Candidatus Wallbacteria bacterium]|nr:serine/threonine protein kinase [Candidatus Wallbacteria bacterium]